MTQELKAPDFSGRYLPPGELVADRFKAGEKIGEGPFGQVYRAEDTLIEAEVALKVFASDLMKTPLDEERFLKATRRARALTQKNVVRLHDGGVHNEHPWVSMQHLEGLNLRKVVGLRRKRGESFGIVELEPILAQITLALQHVGRDHPHGDLKPENIILMPDLIKVTDSYLMSAVPAEEFSKRNADDSFVAPELLGGQEREADVRCDVYSVGAIIGFMLFGEDYQPGAEAGAPGALSAVDALCRRAMAFDPAERYGSVEELAEDFTSIVDTGARLGSSTSSGTAAPQPPPPREAREGGESSEAAVAVAPAPPKAPASPAAPAKQPAGEEKEAGAADPLDVETSPDIGMPLEDDLPTEEYDRETHSPELADLLPTNEVDRDQFPAPRDEKSKDSTAHQAEAKKSAPAPPASPAREAAKKAEKPPRRGSGQASQKHSDRRIGLTAIVIGGIFLLGLVGAGIAAISLFSEGDDEEPEALAQEVDEQGDDESEELVAEVDEEEERLRQERERLLEQVAQAVTTASAVPFEALGAAESAAEERAEELEEEAETETQARAEARPTGGTASGGVASSGGGRPAAQPTQCPSGMVRVSVGGNNVCVDAYQHPGRGRMPQINVSWFDARRLCGQQDKRLCTHQEWRAACGSTYPYGSSFDPDRCNTVDADGFGREPAAGGSFPQCRSRSGAYDMSGNVFEWVQEERVVGGDSDSDADMATCGYSSAMAPSSSRGNVGFRCCADPS